MSQDAMLQKSLAEAVTNLIDSLHRKYSGIMIKPISNYEDEDFTLEIAIPGNLSLNEVEDQVHMECIRIEDEYDLFIFPKIKYGN